MECTYYVYLVGRPRPSCDLLEGEVKVGLAKEHSDRHRMLQCGNAYPLISYGELCFESLKAAAHAERHAQYALRHFKTFPGLPEAVGEWFWVNGEIALLIVMSTIAALYDFDDATGNYVMASKSYDDPPWFVSRMRGITNGIAAAKDPAFRARMAENGKKGNKAMWGNPNFVSRMKTIWQSEEYRAKMAAISRLGVVAQQADPELKAKQSEWGKKGAAIRRANPNYRTQLSEAAKAGNLARRQPAERGKPNH